MIVTLYMAEPNRVVALAVASGRIGAVFFIGNRLMDWRMSDKAATSVTAAADFARKLIAELTPHVFVTEQVAATQFKGDNTKLLIEAVALVASEHELLDVSVPRLFAFANKYDEADALVGRYPELAGWKPKRRRFFDDEPRSTVLFEALVIAEVVMTGKRKEHG